LQQQVHEQQLQQGVPREGSPHMREVQHQESHVVSHLSPSSPEPIGIRGWASSLSGGPGQAVGSADQRSSFSTTAAAGSG
jgi:hypothetical protein